VRSSIRRETLEIIRGVVKCETAVPPQRVRACTRNVGLRCQAEAILVSSVRDSPPTATESGTESFPPQVWL
jgi:hypothetical protein